MRHPLMKLSPLLLLLLGGCQESLYSDLDEKDATAMMAVLMDQGVGCGKIHSKAGWDLAVDKADLPAAVRILAREGYPKHQYKNMGEIFGSKGLISSPQEDRIRYIFALSQEIAETISQIDGVLSSRVHLVLPENDPLSDSLKLSSASVFVKYLPSSAVRQNVTQIKQLVLNGVEGLTMEKVSVVTVPGTQVEAVAVPAMRVAGMQLYKNSLLPLAGIAGVGSIALLALGFALSLLVQRRRAQAIPPVGAAKAKSRSEALASL
ncbi:MAG: type secretion system protein [Fibrobacteres bacterium]|nr:type secretion system protein [Fibrobacterota bacterium]